MMFHTLLAVGAVSRSARGIYVGKGEVWGSWSRGAERDSYDSSASLESAIFQCLVGLVTLSDICKQVHEALHTLLL